MGSRLLAPRSVRLPRSAPLRSAAELGPDPPPFGFLDRMPCALRYGFVLGPEWAVAPSSQVRLCRERHSLPFRLLLVPFFGPWDRRGRPRRPARLSYPVFLPAFSGCV